MTANRRRMASAFLGNIFEHYDTALFALLSPFLAPLFFPDHHPTIALIQIYAMMPLGLLAKPLGSLFFGYLGDTFGRGFALSWSMIGIAIVSALIAFMPTHEHIGSYAAILLTLAKMLQVFFCAGESAGGGIFLLEQTDEKKQDLMSSFYGASTILGVLIASGGVSLLCLTGCIENGWRILFLLGSITALFGFIIRKQNFEESTAPKTSFKEHMKACWSEKTRLIPIAIASAFSYTTYTISLILMNGFVPLVTNVTKTEMMHLNTLLLFIDCIISPFFGWLAHRYSREKMMLMATFSATITGMPLIYLLSGASLFMVVIIRLLLVLMGVWFSATYYSWCQKLVAPNQRYTLLSFGYAMGSQLLGTPAAMISLWLFHQTGLVAAVGLYWVVLAAATSVIILFYRQKENHESLTCEVRNLA